MIALVAAVLGLLSVCTAQVVSTQSGSTWLAYGASQYLSAAGNPLYVLSFKYKVQGHVTFYTSFTEGYANGQTYCVPGVRPTVSLINGACPMDATDSSATCLNIVSNWSPVCLLAFCESSDGCNLALSAIWKNTYLASAVEVPEAVYPITPTQTPSVSPTNTPSITATSSITPSSSPTSSMTPSSSPSKTATSSLTPSQTPNSYFLYSEIIFAGVTVSGDTPISDAVIRTEAASAIAAALSVSVWTVHITGNTYPSITTQALNFTVGVNLITFITTMENRIRAASFATTVTQALALAPATSSQFYAASARVASLQGVPIAAVPSVAVVPTPNPAATPIPAASSGGGGGGGGSSASDILSPGAIAGIAVGAVGALITAIGSIWLEHRKHKAQLLEKAKDEERAQAREEALAKERAEFNGMVINVVARGTTTTSTTVDLARGSGPTLEAATADMLKTTPSLELRNPHARRAATVLPAPDDPR